MLYIVAYWHWIFKESSKQTHSFNCIENYPRWEAHHALHHFDESAAFGGKATELAEDVHSKAHLCLWAASLEADTILKGSFGNGLTSE